jgi:phosphoglycolate phosphatase-like HAD superfamily hydrolase
VGQIPSAVLFDIDGTLITTGGAGGRSWAAAFRRIHGRDADITKFSETGMTDPMVGRSVFRGVMGRDPSQTELAQLIMGYLMELPNAVEESPGYRRLPGVIRTLEHLADGGMLLGLVTGNIEGAARIKIDRAHLNPYFAFGGYGTDSADRAELTRAAITRASTMHGTELDPATVLVVGDTPRDVAAAHAVGAVSVAVATGEYTVERLAGAGADHVLPTLESPFPTEI